MSSSLSKIDASEYLVNGTPIDYDDMSGTLTLDKISDVTATADEVNIMDGVTSTTSELNILDGVAATATELNVLSGISSTSAEIDQRALCVFDDTSVFSTRDMYVVIPWACNVTAVYSVSTSSVTGSPVITIKNNGGSTMGSITLGTSTGSVVSDTTLSNNAFSAGQKLHLDTTTTGTVGSGHSFTIVCDIT